MGRWGRGSQHRAPGFPGQSRTLAYLYYNRYRDYDPTTGRYIQADPIGLNGGANVYLYAEANPLNKIDPEGKIALNLITGAVGALAGGGGNLIGQLIRNGGRWECIDISDVMVATGIGFAAGFVAPVAAPGYIGAIGLGGISSVAQAGLSDLANGRATISNDVRAAAVVGALSGLVGGGVGYSPAGRSNADLISGTGDVAFDRAMNEAARVRRAVSTSNLGRSSTAAILGNSEP